MTVIYQYMSPGTSQWPYARTLDITEYAEVLEVKVRTKSGEFASIKIPKGEVKEIIRALGGPVPAVTVPDSAVYQDSVSIIPLQGEDQS